MLKISIEKVDLMRKIILILYFDQNKADHHLANNISPARLDIKPHHPIRISLPNPNLMIVRKPIINF